MKETELKKKFSKKFKNFENAEKNFYNETQENYFEGNSNKNNSIKKSIIYLGEYDLFIEKGNFYFPLEKNYKVKNF